MEDSLHVRYLQGLSNTWQRTKGTDDSNIDKSKSISDKNDDGDFSKALSILLGQGNSGNNAVNEANSVASNGNNAANVFSLVSEDGRSGATIKPVDNNDTVEVEVLDSKAQSYDEKFSVFDRNTDISKWNVLEDHASADDYSVLDSIGDGLMAAAKIATGLAFGPAKLFNI